MGEIVERTQIAWGGAAPVWVLRLAQECEATSQARTGRLIGYAAGTVSRILSNDYRADTGKVEQAVRGALMQETVSCPVLDEIGKHFCLKHQAREFKAANNHQLKRLWGACRSCPNATREPKEGDA